MVDIGAFACASRCAGLRAGAFHWWRALLWLAVMGVWWLLVGFFDGSVFCGCGELLTFRWNWYLYVVWTVQLWLK